MSTKEHRNNDDQEIDLSVLSHKINDFFESVSNFVFRSIQFILKNIVIFGILLTIGFGLGIYLDKTTKVYNNQIMVQPNFGSVDYLYAKVELLQSRISENDTVFLKSIGIKSPQNLIKIEVKPVVDIYKFISTSPDKNFDLLKLMGEDGDINKIVADEITSKNYTYHVIKFNTSKYFREKDILEPLMNFLNQDEYYNKIKEVAIKNNQIKMQENNIIIAQIDGFLNSFSGVINGSAKSDKLIYYNENTQLNDVIKTKNNLLGELSALRMDNVNMDKIIKKNSSILNVKNTESVTGKLKFILPLILVFTYLIIYSFVSFYRKQVKKQKAS